MRAGLLILILVAAPARTAAPAVRPAPRGVAARATRVQPSSPGEELELAERAFKDGLYRLVALRMKNLVDSRDGPFPGKDRADLLLAASQYLSGQRKEAEERLRKFGVVYPTSRYADECQMWIGRVETEFRQQHKKAETRLRKLYDKMVDERGVGPELLAHCRYYLAKALVEQGGILHLDGYDEAVPDEPGRKKRVHGALELLDQHITQTREALLAEAHVLRGRALYFRGRPQECHDLLLKEFLNLSAFAKNPLRAEAYFWQAESRYGQGRWVQAAELFAKSAKAARSLKNGETLAALARYNRGWALLKRAGDLQRAGLAGEMRLLEASLKSFEQVMSSSKDNLKAAATLRSGEVLHRLGRTLQRTGHTEDAAKRFLQAWKRLEPLYDAKLPDKVRAPEALYISALALAGMKKYEETGKILDRAEGAAADAGLSGPLIARIDFVRGENYFQMAENLKEGKRKRKLLAQAGGAFARIGKSAAPPAERYRARLWSARILAGQGRLAEASKIVDELEKTLPAREVLRKDQLNYYQGLFLLARAHLVRKAADEAKAKQDREKKKTLSDGFADKAIKMFSEARWAGPRGKFAVPSMLGAAEAHLIKNNDFEANRLYHELRVHPLAKIDQVHEAHLGLARTLKAGKRYKKAARYVSDKLLNVKPKPEADLLRRAIKLRADCLASADDSEAASTAYARLASTATEPEKAARAQINRALQMRRAGKHLAAARVLANLADKCPKSLLAEARFRTAEAYAGADQEDEALNYYVLSAKLPGDFQAPALVGAAELEYKAGRPTSAMGHARTAMDAVPAGSLLSARAALVRARALLGLKRFDAAARQYRQAAEAARAQQAFEHNRKRELESRTGDSKAAAAVTESERAFQEGRNKELQAREGLGDALTRLNRREDAAASYLKAAYLVNPAKPDVKMLELAARALQPDKPAAAAEIRKLAAKQKQE